MITHQADPPYPGLGHGTLAHLRGFLSEEEVELVIILFSAVWDEVCVDECGICEEERRDGVSISFSVHVALHGIKMSGLHCTGRVCLIRRPSQLSTFRKKNLKPTSSLRPMVHYCICVQLSLNDLQQISTKVISIFVLFYLSLKIYVYLEVFQVCLQTILTCSYVH